MKLKKLAAMLSLASAAVFVSGAALAAPSITNLDGTKTPFGGFDWTSSSAAWTSGFVGTPGSTFNLNYAGWAGNILNTIGGVIPLGQLDASADGVGNSILHQISPGTYGSYEYTVKATFSEKVVGCASATNCTFQVTGGVFDIYYDVNANAKTQAGAWTGFGDGVKILSGTINPGATTLFDTVTGGQAALNGFVTYTNSTYINPALVSTNVTSTLQLASAITAFAAPTSVDGMGIAAGQIVFQADANQTFSAVPEPSSLALVGLALTGVGFMARRRKSV